jgi:hypothetical protein
MLTHSQHFPFALFFVELHPAPLHLFVSTRTAASSLNTTAFSSSAFRAASGTRQIPSRRSTAHRFPCGHIHCLAGASSFEPTSLADCRGQLPPSPFLAILNLAYIRRHIVAPLLKHVSYRSLSLSLLDALLAPATDIWSHLWIDGVVPVGTKCGTGKWTQELPEPLPRGPWNWLAT